MRNGLLAFVLVAVGPLSSQGVPFDDRPAAADEWGFRPAHRESVSIDPPAFVWRPQQNAISYALQVGPDGSALDDARVVEVGSWPVHCPAERLGVGGWQWRVRAARADGTTSVWSGVRRFTVAVDAAEFAIPERAELLARVPDAHPRLFVRPGDLVRLRVAAAGPEAARRDALVAQCERIVAEPPPTGEPPLYPAGTVRGSDPWREIWWGNRRRTIAVLESAATLAFTHWLTDEPRFAAAAKELLLAAARWDPRGATGYRYNDEAGMPYAYHFARAYTFLHAELSEGEREQCRDVLRARGREMFAHLCPGHFWRPYSSHSNRAWHFLGEIGVALHGEEPEADEWLWFAMNVFGAVYPVWSDADGGWHEGLAYWRSYLDRFTWWADVMRAAVGVDAYRRPFFARVGDFAMYLQPPGTRGGGFGDLCGRLTSDGNATLVGLFAAASRNPYWQWYRDAHDDVADAGGYVAFLRAAGGRVDAKPPHDLPASKLFEGTGVAALNTTLMDGRQNVEVLFKSSPLGTQSHGYDAQNAFLLYAYGERLLIRSGRRDSYGSEHHRRWMWSTRSSNSVTVDELGQVPHSPKAVGRIAAFETTAGLDLVSGDAGDAYDGVLERFTRTIVFAKPGLVVVYDRLRASEPRTFTAWLHAEQPFDLTTPQTARLEVGDAACAVRFLAPSGLRLQQSDAFDPPPRPRVKLVEHHLTASTPEPQREVQFVTVIDVGRRGALHQAAVTCERSGAGYRLRAETGSGVLEVDLVFSGPIRATLGPYVVTG